MRANAAQQCLGGKLRTMHTHYYPMFVSLEKRVCLVIGGGSVGERKVRGLLQYGAAIRLLAEHLTPWLQAQCSKGTVLLVGKAYAKGHLDKVDLVFAATNDLTLNRQVARDAEECRLWCNMATEPEVGSFIVPSILRKGPLTIAISTGGASPAVAVQIKQKLAREFGEEWIVLLNLMALLRTSIQSRGSPSAQNQEIYRKIAELPLLEWIQNGEETQILQAISDNCHPWVNFMELKLIWDEAWKQSS
jgi:precorrin-2 dehydrogenase/sirohydrochlorin ferrochelatase